MKTYGVYKTVWGFCLEWTNNNKTQRSYYQNEKKLYDSIKLLKKYGFVQK